MLLPLLPLRAATLAFTGWIAAVPGPSGDSARLEIQAASTLEATAPVSVELYDVNHDESATITINRDGSVDPRTAKVVKRLLRCKRTDRSRKISRKTLAMFANVAATWSGHTIEIVSGYRAMRSESRTSPHRGARAIDFRVRGVSTRLVRDYMWREFRTVGVGWYPEGNYVHLDARPGLNDTAWTFANGKNRYHPSWAERIRPAYVEPVRKPKHKRHKKKPQRRYHGAGV
jgi:uncharacterized protein YcbK (DUF882 family)